MFSLIFTCTVPASCDHPEVYSESFAQCYSTVSNRGDDQALYHLSGTVLYTTSYPHEASATRRDVEGCTTITKNPTCSSPTLHRAHQNPMPVPIPTHFINNRHPRPCRHRVMMSKLGSKAAVAENLATFNSRSRGVVRQMYTVLYWTSTGEQFFPYTIQVLFSLHKEHKNYSSYRILFSYTTHKKISKPGGEYISKSLRETREPGQESTRDG